jgi:lipoprotein-anchoring transpeptidase ErfK/SrfK
MMTWRTALAAVAAAGAVGLVSATALAQAPPSTTPAPPPAPGVIAPGVSIADVAVGGLDQAAARQAVIATHVVPRRAPVVATFRGRNLKIDAVRAGYVADVDYAIQVALLYGRSKAVPAEGVAVPLKEKVNAKRLRAILTARARAYDVPARDATLRLKGVTPVVTKARIGTAIDVAKSATTVAHAILFRDVPKVALATKRLIPAVRSVGPVVIVDRGNFRLTWWKAGRKITFPIAVGSPEHPTPTGNYHVTQKQMNPTWFPPDSPWAAGLGPVPPGVNNPLGTRWIGTSAPAIGMHGTPISSSIGSRASHGCIRMYIRDAERLYDLVDIGTPVYIR